VTSRPRSAAVLGIVLLAGLGSRRVDSLPGFVITHAGDVLWATAVVLTLALVRPAWSPYRLCATGFGLAVAIEFSQLWGPRWLVDLRDNEVAALVLGKGFVWGDLLRYALGIAVAFLLLDALRRPQVGQA
jgi:uncharacterized protein DUF2809